MSNGGIGCADADLKKSEFKKGLVPASLKLRRDKEMCLQEKVSNSFDFLERL